PAPDTVVRKVPLENDSIVNTFAEVITNATFADDDLAAPPSAGPGTDPGGPKESGCVCAIVAPAGAETALTCTLPPRHLTSLTVRILARLIPPSPTANGCSFPSSNRIRLPCEFFRSLWAVTTTSSIFLASSLLS